MRSNWKTIEKLRKYHEPATVCGKLVWSFVHGMSLIWRHAVRHRTCAKILYHYLTQVLYIVNQQLGKQETTESQPLQLFYHVNYVGSLANVYIMINTLS